MMAIGIRHRLARGALVAWKDRLHRAVASLGARRPRWIGAAPAPRHWPARHPAELIVLAKAARSARPTL